MAGIKTGIQGGEAGILGCEMTERTLKTALVWNLADKMIGAVVLSHTGAINAGIPDLSITWNGKTTWLEVKYLNPKLSSRGIQELMLKRLAKQGSAYYVIYQNINRRKRTGIVEPSQLATLGGLWRDEIDHGFVANFVRQTHLPLDSGFKP